MVEKFGTLLDGNPKVKNLMEVPNVFKNHMSCLQGAILCMTNSWKIDKGINFF